MKIELMNTYFWYRRHNSGVVYLFGNNGIYRWR